MSTSKDRSSVYGTFTSIYRDSHPRATAGEISDAFLVHQRREWASKRAAAGNVFPSSVPAAPPPPAQTERRSSYCRALSGGGPRCGNCGAVS
jgi:hypothetical protein